MTDPRPSPDAAIKVDYGVCSCPPGEGCHCEPTRPDPDCNLDECRFFDGPDVGYTIVCFNPNHRDRVCPLEGEMFRRPRYTDPEDWLHRSIPEPPEVTSCLTHPSTPPSNGCKR